MKIIVSVRGTKYVRVASCKSGKLKFAAPKIIAVIMLCIMFCSCATKSEHSASWMAYCAKYNVNADTPSISQENYYLDCYVGSAEEEYDLENL